MGRHAAASAIADVLRAASSVVIGSHVDPDGDAVGSSLALALALGRSSVPCEVVAAQGAECPVTYAFLPAACRYRSAEDLDPPAVFVSLDAPNLDRLGTGRALAERAGTLIVVDHHPDAVSAGVLNLIDPAAPATGVLVYDIIRALGVTLDIDIATCLYTALVTDTGRFSHSNTGPEAFAVAGELVAAGVHPNDIVSAVYENRSLGALSLTGRVLERLTLANGGAVAYSWLAPGDMTETGVSHAETENLIDQVRAIGGVEVVFLVKLDVETARVSLRAKGATDVGAVARTFGGGGHRPAAGFTVRASLDEVLASLLPQLPGGAR